MAISSCCSEGCSDNPVIYVTLIASAESQKCVQDFSSFTFKEIQICQCILKSDSMVSLSASVRLSAERMVGGKSGQQAGRDGKNHDTPKSVS